MFRGRSGEQVLELWRKELVEVTSKLEAGSSRGEERLFQLERLGWCLVQLATHWVFSGRLGIPGKEDEAFQILARAEKVSFEEARKLRCLAEYRKLSSRLLHEIDPSLQEAGPLPDLELARMFGGRVPS